MVIQANNLVNHFEKNPKGFFEMSKDKNSHIFKVFGCFHADSSRLMVLATKEIQDVENAGSNHRFCLCFERLSRESFSRGYAPGAESALQIGDRHTGRVSLLTAV